MRPLDMHCCTIAFDELERVQEFAFSVLGMNREQVMENFDDVYEDTLSVCQETMECRALWRGFAVESTQDDAIQLEGGVELRSRELSEMLRRADEVVMYAVSAIGCEELANNPTNDVFESMFYNAWGVGLSMASHAWVKRAIADYARETGRFAGRGWAPGEGAVEASLQQVLFDAIDPGQIGVTLVGGVHMHPVMTITGIMGLSPDPAIELDGADRVQNH